jgi:hypothetical protein
MPTGGGVGILSYYIGEFDEMFTLPGVTPLGPFILTVINTASPMIFKLLVDFERWDDPEVVVRQKLYRQLVLKMTNLIILFFVTGMGTVSMPLPASAVNACPEAEAAKTFIVFLISDCVMHSVLLPLGKAVPYYLKRILCKKDQKKPLDLPTEIVNICYRQLIAVIGSLVAPWLFLLAFITNIILYFSKYLQIMLLHKPPDKPYKANNIKKYFYMVLFVSNLLGLFPVGYFLTARSNPNCGPMRSYECAMETACGANTLFVNSGQNQTACLYSASMGRPNYQVFTEILLQDRVDFNPLDALVQATKGNVSALSDFASNCSAGCWISFVLSSIFHSVTMMFVALLLGICLCFARAQASRLNKQLDESQEECASEHHDKVKLLRYAGVSLD